MEYNTLVWSGLGPGSSHRETVNLGDTPKPWRNQMIIHFIEISEHVQVQKGFKPVV
jgi:hypothetical protein